MNVNGSSFHLLLGDSDWGRCLASADEAAGSWARLRDAWLGSGASPPAAADAPQPAVLAWDVPRRQLRLQSLPIELGVTAGDAPLTPDMRRSAAADRNGNIYWIGDDPHRLRVQSAGSEQESAFWPDGPVDCSGGHRQLRSDFAPMAAEVSGGQRFTALSVTEDHYLVVAFTTPSAAGLVTFDLMAGGPPVETLWPASVTFAPFDMAQRKGGGVWVLDRVHRRVWELDRRLQVVSRSQAEVTLAPAETDVFQPAHGASRARPAATFPGGIDLGSLVPGPLDPISVEALAGGGLLILDRAGEVGKSRVLRLRRHGDTITVDGAAQLDDVAHDFVLAVASVRPPAPPVVQLLVAGPAANQALAFSIGPDREEFAVHESAELFPLRRFGGRALLAVRGAAYYDSGAASPRWVPIVQQPRSHYRDRADLITPVFDGLELQCVWDRVMLDACIPSGASVEIWCRASDERAPIDVLIMGPLGGDEVIGAWTLQPQPYLRADGAEIPWVGTEAVPETQRASGTGSWELLLQNARGRYLQIRLRLSGNGSVTPWLGALRAWYPRFSYSQRFLPAVWREDPVQSDFIERFLANFEGINSVIEGRIVQVQALFDPGIAPAEALEWLAGWFDVALDPSWQDWRRRLFIRNAMDFFRWRGTVHGLQVALALALQNCLDDRLFDDPDPNCVCPQSIRIVEGYLSRLAGPVAAGDPGASTTGPGPVKLSALWSPQEGSAGLVQRYAACLDRPATPAEQVRPFALFPPQDATLLAGWNAFSATNLGFVPSAGADDRRRWQNFLFARSAGLDDLKARHGVAYSSFDTIDLPKDWPGDGPLGQDWRDFCALTAEVLPLGRWQDFLARRYRNIQRLNAAHQTAWPSFDLIALPDYLPGSASAQTDWLQFERQLMAIIRSAHRFSVLLPVTSVTADPFEMQRQIALARRVVELEKPAHTVFDIRFYWALNRVGEARLGLDTLLDQGSRAPQLIPDAVLGRAYLGESFVGGPLPPSNGDRRLLAC